MESKPNFKLGDVTTSAKKRWSGISVNSKLYLVYDKLAKEEEEEYTDSLENACHNKHLKDELVSESTTLDEAPDSLDSNFADEHPINGRRFKKLQQKWELLSGRDSPPPSSPQKQSKIPRPITSPGKPPNSGIPVLISPTSLVRNKSVKKTPPVKNVKSSAGVKTTPVKKSVVSGR